MEDLLVVAIESIEVSVLFLDVKIRYRHCDFFPFYGCRGVVLKRRETIEIRFQ